MRKKLTWLHISDIHFQTKTEWRDSTIRSSLLAHLKSNFETNPTLRPDLIFCTGDIAFGESASASISSQYDQAKVFFDELLKVCGGITSLPKTRLFLVPGNHDVNRSSINNDAQSALVGMAKNASKYADEINQRFNDKSREFKDAIKRLDEYSEFISTYLPHQQDNDERHHYAITTVIDGLTVGIAGFNSAWSCAGNEDDRHIWLAAKWQFNAAQKAIRDSDIRIGLMHHPIDWLNTADSDIAKNRISTDFDFWLHGHIHSTWVNPTNSHVVIAAGAVGAADSDEFGINIVSIDLTTSNGTAHLHSAKSNTSEWTIAPIAHHAPLGNWKFDLPARIKNKKYSDPTEQKNGTLTAIADAVGSILSQKLDDALQSYSDQPVVWITPTLSKIAEADIGVNDTPKVNITDFISEPKFTIIKAPAQHGLTSLARYLAKEAWCQQEPSLWIYLDSKQLKPNKASFDEAITKELADLDRQESEIRCVLLDSWNSQDKDAIKLLSKLTEHLNGLPIICMQRIELGLTNPNESNVGGRQFDSLYLWSLPRNQIRKIVSTYNDATYIGNEDAVTSRIVSDLETFNLHRTVFNCLTLLKAYEANFIESPINRSEMINRVLFQLFNSSHIPTYKTRPDLQDCEYVLGYFCEMLIREDTYFFPRDKFLLEIQRICEVQLIDLEIQVVFDVLYANNILVKKGDVYCFRFSFWIFYFAAHRMHHDPSFAQLILGNLRYAIYPELIEFYTGIDRKREDALNVLIKDLREVSSKVKENCGFPDGLNPYRFAKWTPSPEAHAKMQDEIMHGVLESNLPDEIKDQFADQTYDRTRPYNQSIRSVLSEPSFWCMLQVMRAGAKALRNSDYASTSIKRQLLHEILNCWEQASKVLLVVLPVLANEGYAVFDGTGIFLIGDFGATPQEKFMRILGNIPSNVIGWCKDDLNSQKMGPLLIDQLSNEENSDISKHELVLLLIHQRPRGWDKQVSLYIVSLAKDSFFLFDIFSKLQIEYRYSFASPDVLEEIKHLIMVSATKHVTGNKDPSMKAISKVKFIEDPVPPREV
jgi:predicted phosphodiesterase